MIGKAQPVAFLDRDGVLNFDTGYLWRPEECQWIPGSAPAVSRLNRAGYRVVIVTNQSGIGRGLYSEEEFRSFSRWYETELRSRGAMIDLTLYCPHHPTEGLNGYQIDCDCRKPKPGMLNQVFQMPDVRREGSFLIGDRETDLVAATAAGIPGYLFDEENLDLFVARLLEAG